MRKYYFFNKGLLIWDGAKHQWYVQATFSYLRKAATVPCTNQKAKEIFQRNKLIRVTKGKAPV